MNVNVNDKYNVGDNNNSTYGKAESPPGVKTSHGSVVESGDLGVFQNATPSMEYSVITQHDSTFADLESAHGSHENFFQRPVRIQQYSLTVGQFMDFTFNPWIDYFDTPSIRERIKNFNSMQATLQLEFRINGNGFYYGTLMAAYEPLSAFNGFRTTSGGGDLLMLMSQRPHVLLNPTTSQGGSIELPFFWYNNYLSIPDRDMENMGTCRIRSMGPLRNINGSDDPLTLSVFVHAKDIKLRVPTTVIDDFDSQFGVVELQAGDEHTKSPVSTVASAIAGALGKLGNVPTIGPYMRATSVIASGVASVARIFGYSRPVDLRDVSKYQPTFTGNLANTNVGDTSVKLALDAKQELSIDPRTVGLNGTDELSIKHIAGREAYFASFAVTDTATLENAIIDLACTPLMYRPVDSDGDIHMTPCCVAAAPFGNWRGTMRFRFLVDIPAMVKGRMKISYDPNFHDSNDYHTKNYVVVDLGETKDFTIDVPWAQNQAYLKCDFPRSRQAAKPRSAFLLPPDREFLNGILRVRMMNKLMSPSTEDVFGRIHVFVSCPDLEVRNPVDDIFDSATYSPLGAQMGEDTNGVGKVAPDELMSPTSTNTKFDIVGSGSSDNNIDLVFFGENVVSFRTLLRRYSRHCGRFFNAGRFGCLYRWTKGNFPEYNNTASSISQDGNVHTAMTMLNFITPCFLGYRGGVRWKYMIGSHNLPIEIGYHSVIRGGSQNEISLGNRTSANAGLFARTYCEPTNAGAEIQPLSTVPTLSVEVPYHSATRFTPTRLNASTISEESFRHRYNVVTSATGDMAMFVDTFVAAGEDFTCFFFIGAPPLNLPDAADLRENFPPLAN